MVTSVSSAGLKAMAGEALNRRNIWEPSVYFALGKESFYFAGQDISIHESMDTYGALIWPGVRRHRRKRPPVCVPTPSFGGLYRRQ